jgi:hypothetical protein
MQVNGLCRSARSDAPTAKPNLILHLMGLKLVVHDLAHQKHTSFRPTHFFTQLVVTKQLVGTCA